MGTSLISPHCLRHRFLVNQLELTSSLSVAPTPEDGKVTGYLGHPLPRAQETLKDLELRPLQVDPPG